jgi:hypothetical protein
MVKKLGLQLQILQLTSPQIATFCSRSAILQIILSPQKLRIFNLQNFLRTVHHGTSIKPNQDTTLNKFWSPINLYSILDAPVSSAPSPPPPSPVCTLEAENSPGTEYCRWGRRKWTLQFQLGNLFVKTSGKLESKHHLLPAIPGTGISIWAQST